MKFPHVFAAAALAVAFPTLSLAAPSLTASNASHVWLVGESTLHPYHSTATVTEFMLQWTPEVAQSTAPVGELLALAAQRAPFQTFDLVIPVKDLKSGEARLDKNMQEALKIKTAPAIEYKMTGYHAQPATDKGIAFEAPGTLSIAGVIKEVTLTGIARATADSLVVDGQYTLKMTDYGIKPPTLLMGTIRVADPVTIHFHLQFQPQTKGVSQ